MIRRLTTIASVLSLSLFAITCFMWARGYWIGEMAEWAHSSRTANGYANSDWVIGSAGGGCSFSYFHELSNSGMRSGFKYNRFHPRRHMYGVYEGPFPWRTIGFQLVHTTDKRWRAVLFPHYAVCTAFTLLPLLRWTRPKQRTDGRCCSCGYDLRASAGRFPECGAAIIAAAAE